MLEDILLLVTATTLILFSLQSFMTPNNRKSPSKMLTALVLAFMSFFIFYFWQTNVSLPTGGNKYMTTY